MSAQTSNGAATNGIRLSRRRFLQVLAGTAGALVVGIRMARADEPPLPPEWLGNHFHELGAYVRIDAEGNVLIGARDPDTGTYNASYHRLQITGPGRTGVKLDFGRHLRLAFERAKQKGEDLPVAVCIGSDLALHYTAATMGSQMPEHADELAVAGGLCGRPLPVVKAVSQDLIVPAETEILRRMAQASPIRAIASVRAIAGGSYKKAFSVSGPQASWAAETAGRDMTTT